MRLFSLAASGTAALLCCLSPLAATAEDVNALAASKWSLLKTPMPYNLTYHSCVWQPTDSSSVALIMGGTNKYVSRPAAWIFGYDVVTQAVQSLNPSPLPMIASAAGGAKGKVYVYQNHYPKQEYVPGYENTTILTYDVASNSWGQIVPVGGVEPSRDTQYASNWVTDSTEENLILYKCDGVWSLNPDKKKWKLLAKPGDGKTAPDCSSWSKAWAGDAKSNTAYLVEAGEKKLTAVWRFNIGTKKWTKLDVSGLGSALLTPEALTAAVLKGTLYIYGDAPNSAMYSINLKNAMLTLSTYTAPAGATVIPARQPQCLLPLPSGNPGLYTFGGVIYGPPNYTGSDVWRYDA